MANRFLHKVQKPCKKGKRVQKNQNEREQDAK